MAQGRSVEIISMIKGIRTSRLSIKRSLSRSIKDSLSTTNHQFDHHADHPSDIKSAPALRRGPNRPFSNFDFLAVKLMVGGRGATD